METFADGILPPSFFEGINYLWSSTTYVAGAIVAIAAAFSVWSHRGDSTYMIRLLARLIMVAVAIVCLRDWLLRLGDVVAALGSEFDIDPKHVDEKFLSFLSGSNPSSPNASAWDVIWDTGSIGTAIAYALVWLFGWFTFGLQFIVKLIGDVLLSVGWALSPLFLAFFFIRPMAGVGLKYILRLVVLVCWPFGWVIAAVVTNALLETAAYSRLVPIAVPGGPTVAPLLTMLIICVWMLVSTAAAPMVVYNLFMNGANPASGFAEASMGVAQSAFSGATGAAVAVATGGAGIGGIVAAAAAGGAMAGAESTARSGGSSQITNSAISGLAGLYRGANIQRQVGALEKNAAAQQQSAAAAEAFTSELQQRVSKFKNQPHHPNPNQAAIDIDSHA